MSKNDLWTLRTSETLTADMWQRFDDACRRAGNAPGPVIESMILGFISRTGQAPNYMTPTDAPTRPVENPVFRDMARDEISERGSETFDAAALGVFAAKVAYVVESHWQGKMQELVDRLGVGNERSHAKKPTAH